MYDICIQNLKNHYLLKLLDLKKKWKIVAIIFLILEFEVRISKYYKE